MSGPWGKPASRKESEVRDVVDKLFWSRHWDLGTCETCGADKSGVFGPPENDKFHCGGCWTKYLRDLNSEEWKKWTVEWTLQSRKCVTESSHHHELKCTLLALSRVGGTFTLPCSLSAYDRMKVHTFCEKEPELASLVTKSYGEGCSRFLRVSRAGGADAESASTQARAILLAEDSKTATVGTDLLAQSGHILDQCVGIQLHDVPLSRLMEFQRQLTITQQHIADVLEVDHGVKPAGFALNIHSKGCAEAALSNNQVLKPCAPSDGDADPAPSDCRQQMPTFQTDTAVEPPPVEALCQRMNALNLSSGQKKTAVEPPPVEALCQDPDKRIKALKKKLAQIEKLELRGGEYSREEQEKIESKSTILAELGELESPAEVKVGHVGSVPEHVQDTLSQDKVLEQTRPSKKQQNRKR